jgi:ribosomal protein S6--L-glutamate ligase
MDNAKVACLMKIMIVYGRGLDDNNKQLYAACKKFVGKLVLARIMDMSAYVGPERSRFWHGDKELGHIDLCFLRSFGLGSCEQITKRVSMMEHLELSGTFMVNSTFAYGKAKDKYSMTYTLARAGLPVPRTYVTEMAHWAYRASGGFKQAIYKPIVGSLGFGSMKFESIDLAFNAYETLERLGQPLYVQEYLEKPGRDIRAFVLGDKVLASVYRVAQLGEWKTNVAQGAQTKPIQLSIEFQELAVKAAKALNLLYAGVDIFETEQGAVIAEVNVSPSWQGVQRATGVNIAESLVRFAIDCIKH